MGVFVKLYPNYPLELHGLRDVELLVYMQLLRDFLECYNFIDVQKKDTRNIINRMVTWEYLSNYIQNIH